MSDRMLSDEILLGLIKKNGGGGGGTTNYNQLENKPQIGGVTLQGDKSLADLGIASAQSVSNITNGESINNFAGVETALSGKQDTLTFDDTPTDNSNNPVKSNGIYDALALKQNATDNSLNTDAKTIVGAINEHEGDVVSLKSGLATLDTEVNGDSTTYPYADVITIEDAVPANLADCNVKIEPIQDLHGYDHPWVGGAYKNKCDNSTNIVGYYDGSGNYSASDDYKTSALIEVSPNTTYTASLFDTSDNSRKAGLVYTEWDASQNFIQQVANVETITTGATTKYLRLRNYNAQTALVQSNNYAYQLEEGSTATDYAPYENICPISGHTEASVQRDGKNLADGIVRPIVCGQDNVYLNATLPYGSIVVPIVGGRDYTVSIKNAQTIFTSTCAEFPENGDTTVDALSGTSGASVTHKTVSTSANAKYLVVHTGSYDYEEFQVELGSSATDYEPFKGKTYTIALGSTIYGGIVRIDSNGNTVMDVDDVKKVFDGSEDETWTTRTTQSGYTLFEIILSNTRHSTSQTQVGLCNEFPWSITYETDKSYRYYQTTLGIRYDGLTPTEFKEWLSSNELEVTLPLATPTTIQLTPQQIQLLKGQNTITASTGQISVTVNGVAGAIGSVQEQVNELAGDVAEIKTLNYSTTEQKTGQKWIDGKDVYFRTFEFSTAISITNSSWTSLGIDATEIDTIIDAILHFEPTGIRGAEVRVDSGLIKAISTRAGGSSDTFDVDRAIIYYTKTT